MVSLINKRKYEIKINNNKITIKTGDIFKQNGIIVIPFNEYFDTKVDDIIISSQTLNGKFILNYIKQDIEEFNRNLKKETSSPLKGRMNISCNKIQYPLGCIKKWENFALLALSHFDEYNRANISVHEYEKCVANMWDELNRIYAGYPISIPLIGGGITRFKGRKLSPNELMNCLLCTFKRSQHSFTKEITFVILDDTFDDIQCKELCESFQDK